MKWTLINPAGTNDPDTGDIYSGLDRFGRVKDHRWLDGAGADLDRIQYGYDRAGNRLWRRNVVAAALGKEFDELYGYDAIHRLKHMARGTLNGGRSALTSETFAQCWTLDSTGNWQGFREDDDGNGTWDLIQQRTANPVNEISGVTETTGPSWVTPAYSRAGNMTTMPQPADPTQSYTATYDAWNRLVKLADGADTVAEYQYDGARRRIVQKSYTDGVLSETRHLYYTQPSQWQVIEERVGTSPDSAPAERQFVWGLRYIDDLVLRDRDTDDNGSLDERLYALQDANWNVTGIVDDAEDVQERYAYSAYGISIFMSRMFVPLATSLLDVEHLFGSYRCEAATRLLHVRCRTYHVVAGTWVQRDALRFTAGLHLYSYCRSSPLQYRDPWGLQAADDYDQNWPNPQPQPPLPYPFWNLPSDRWQDDWSEGWNVDSVLNPANWAAPDSSCGSSAGTLDVSATVISENSAFTTPESIMSDLNAGGLNGFPTSVSSLQSGNLLGWLASDSPTREDRRHAGCHHDYVD